MAFCEHDDIVYPYIESVKEYLLAGADADITEFAGEYEKQSQDVIIEWTKADIPTDSFYIEIATKEDYSDAERMTLTDEDTSFRFKFLMMDTTYYIRLTAQLGDSIRNISTQFTTTDMGPRFLDVGGQMNNGRDLGGYTVNGKTVLNNMVIRGSAPDANNATSHGELLTEDGAYYLNNVVRIKTQIDMRSSSESGGRTKSSFDNANYYHIPLTAGKACFTNEQANYYKQVFEIFAEEENYPVFFHCVGGADRTGTVAALLLALLGVDEDQIIQDYVVTSFSSVGLRSRDGILKVLDGLDAYEGNDLSEKCESYLSSIGISKKKIFAIKAIMFGEDPEDNVETPDYSFTVSNYYFDTSSEKDIALTLNEEIGIIDVRIDDNSANYEKNGRIISIKNSSLKTLTDGNHTITLIFEDEHEAGFDIGVNYLDITGTLQVVNMSESGDYTTIYIESDRDIFDGIDYHFHTRSDSKFPLVKPNIKINNKTIEEINAEADLSDYEWTSSPGKDDSRHQVAVSIVANDNWFTLLINTEWLDSYLDGEDIMITICEGFEFTNNSKTYKVLSDIKTVYRDGMWWKI